MQQEFFANGKLLITGEYFVLKGAQALAIPTRRGQHLQVIQTTEPGVHWQSLDEQGNVWFSAAFSTDYGLELTDSSDAAQGKKLQHVLQQIHHQRPGLFQSSLQFKTQLDFPRQWGWGSSSTLISLLSQWAEIDAFELLQKTFGGSGYDVACAQAAGPIFYQLQDGQPLMSPAPIPRYFLDNLYLVYLGKKQGSAEEVARFHAQGEVDEGLIRQVSQLTQMTAKSADLGTFCACMQELERITGDHLERTPVQESLFKSLPGAAKSLGAWGGDFVLLATPWPHEKVEALCNDLGLTTVLNFEAHVKF